MQYIQWKKYPGNTTQIHMKETPYLSFKALDRIGFVRHGFSTRLGGISEGHLSSMNLGWERGEPRENVVKNHELIGKAIGFEAKNVVTSHQTHTTNVVKVTREDRGKGVYFPRELENVDGLVTNDPNVVLATYFADCVPLYLVDVKQKAIGLTHSGWRGTVGKIGQMTIKKMQECFGTKPEDLVVCIGPSICQDCYEVSKDVAEEFEKAFPGHIDEVLKEKGNDKFLLDLWRSNELIFLEAGVLPENIHTTDLCTCCNPDILFSHRATNGKRGNLAAFLEISGE